MTDTNARQMRTFVYAALALAFGSWCADRLSRTVRERRKVEREDVSRWEDEGGAAR